MHAARKSNQVLRTRTTASDRNQFSYASGSFTVVYSNRPWLEPDSPDPPHGDDSDDPGHQEATAMATCMDHPRRPHGLDCGTSALVLGVKPIATFMVRKEISPGHSGWDKDKAGFSPSSAAWSSSCLPPSLGSTSFKSLLIQVSSSCPAPISPLHTSRICLGRDFSHFYITFLSQYKSV